MNGLASSDPLSTQHRSGGGGSRIPAFSVWAGGRSLLQPALARGMGLLCKSGLMEVSLKVAHEGRRVTACSGLLPCLSLSWILQTCLRYPIILADRASVD